MNGIRNDLPVFFTSAVLVAALAMYPNSQAIAQTASTPAVSLTGPCPVKADNLRGKNHYEIIFMNRNAEGPGGKGRYYNSLGNSFEAPAEEVDARFRSQNAEALKKEYGSDGVFFNGPRRFLANSVTGLAFNDCKLRVIDNIPMFLYGVFEAPSFDGFLSGPPVAYKVLVSQRSTTFTFNAGEQVYELVTPEGGVYTMFSVSLKTDPNNSVENLPTLGKRLKLPEGWKYRTRTLDKNLVLSSTVDANPPNTIAFDQFENNYQLNRNN